MMASFISRSRVLFDNIKIPLSAKPFETIETNDYSSFKSESTSAWCLDSVLPCECLPKIGACDANSSCINRLLFMECNEDCPAGRFCQNKLFSKKIYFTDLQVFESPGKGCGLKTKSFIPAGTFILEYVGEILSPETMAKRIENIGPNTHYYFMTLHADQIIDAYKKGNISRFINHSCAPNCQTQKWIVGNRMRIGIFSISDIHPDSELTFDYKFQQFGTDTQDRHHCLCGEPNCKGVIGSSSSRIKKSSSDESSSEECHSLSKIQNFKEPKGIEDPVKLPLLLKKLITVESVLPLQRHLQILNATTSLVCLRRLVQLHGLLIFKTLLSIYRKEPSIIYFILNILSKIPVSSRNKIEDSGIEQVITTLFPSTNFETDTNSDQYMLYQMSQQLISSWSNLPRTFKIPKKSHLSEGPKTPFCIDQEVSWDIPFDQNNPSSRSCSWVEQSIFQGTDINSTGNITHPDILPTCIQNRESREINQTIAIDTNCHQNDVFLYLLDSTINSLSKTMKHGSIPIESFCNEGKKARSDKISESSLNSPAKVESFHTKNGSGISSYSLPEINQLQLQHIIRRATLSANPVEQSDILTSEHEYLKVAMNREAWAKLLKTQVVSIVSNILSRYAKQMDKELFKKLNRKVFEKYLLEITHSLLDKEAKNHETQPAPRTFTLDERLVSKIKTFAKEYIYKLGYKKTDAQKHSK